MRLTPGRLGGPVPLLLPQPAEFCKEMAQNGWYVRPSTQSGAPIPNEEGERESGMTVVIITRRNVGRVTRWRGERSGTHTYLQAMLDGEWCQVVVTRSDPACLPPRSVRSKVGEYIWFPSRRGPGSG